MKKKIIFHHPLPLKQNATSASEIRPIKMIEAFETLGYEVAIVAGYGKERKELIGKIKQQILEGEKFYFLYAESSTQPTLLTEKNHLPKNPFVDFYFFRFCKQNQIKIGLFYRDIYWLFPEYGKNLSFWKNSIAKIFYRFDLNQYNKHIDVVYLPSMEMAKYIPSINSSKFKALPPGHDKELFSVKIKKKSHDIKLLYIGGLGEHYQMHKLFDALEEQKKIHFTLCTREEEWQKVKNEYSLSSNISIVHKSGYELKELYESSDIAVLFVKPQEYREFAAPVKLFEYIGEEKPIIASCGTLAGEFVKKYNVGWCVKYNREELLTVLDSILSNMLTIREKQNSIQDIKNSHSWIMRATQVAKDLQ